MDEEDIEKRYSLFDVEGSLSQEESCLIEKIKEKCKELQQHRKLTMELSIDAKEVEESLGLQIIRIDLVTLIKENCKIYQNNSKGFRQSLRGVYDNELKARYGQLVNIESALKKSSNSTKLRVMKTELTQETNVLSDLIENLN